MNKDSATEDIIIDSIEEIANVFFEEQSESIEKLLNGEIPECMFDMGIKYDVFLPMINQVYGKTEEDVLDAFREITTASIFIDKMPSREVFEIQNVEILLDPYSDVVVKFNVENVVED